MARDPALVGLRAYSAARPPNVDFRREVTVEHLMLDCETSGAWAKVNPPIRPREGVEFLWTAVLAGHVDWIVSDHACCSREMKVSIERPDDVWLAKAGFGGTEYLLPAVFSEGTRRGLPPHRIAELSSWSTYPVNSHDPHR